MTDDAVHESSFANSIFPLVPLSSVVVERSEKVQEAAFPALSVGKRGVTPQLEGVAKTQTESDRKLVRAGDLVINSRSDRRGASGMARQDGSVSLVYSVMTPTSALVAEYGHHLMRSLPFQEEFFRWGVGIVDDLWSTNFTRMSRIRLPLPPLATQRAIAGELDEVEAMIRKLDELAIVLRRRLTHTAAVFGLADTAQQGAQNDSHTPLAGIPQHWQRTKFGFDFFESTERAGMNPPGPLLSISEYRGVELNTRTKGQQASLDVANYRVVRPGQLAANMMWLNHGGLGVSDHTGYISPDYKAFWISERFHSRYVHHLFRSSRYIDYFAAIGTGVRPNAQRVTKTVLDATPVPLPPLEEQIQIADRLDEVAGKVDEMLAKVAVLRELLVERCSAFVTDVVTGKKEVA